MAHDFKKFPELTNSQMNFYYFESPHEQITSDFTARVERVIDGDTIEVKCDFRSFGFPIRFSNILAPEKNEEGGIESAKWLKNEIEGEIVDIKVDSQNRVGKWGRILGEVTHKGIDIGEMSIQNGHSIGIEEERGKVEELHLLLNIEDFL